MNRQRWVARAVLLVAVACGVLSATSAAPVPKAKPREGTIVIGTDLYNVAGTKVGKLPFENAQSCVLSPDGTRAVVCVHTQNYEQQLVVGRVGATPDEVGSVLDTVSLFASVAWGGNEKLYVTDHYMRTKRSWSWYPGRVTVYDLERGTATEDKALHGYAVRELSADGKRLLATRVIADPVERHETVLLDAATGKLAGADIGELSSPRFYGTDGLIGSRTKRGAPNDEEWVVYDLTTNRATPLKVPKNVTASKGYVDRVLPSPDCGRLLYVWGEEAPAPDNWPGIAGPFRVTRLTTCDRDGGNARTIFKPEIKTREDETRNHFGGTIDWR